MTHKLIAFRHGISALALFVACTFTGPVRSADLMEYIGVTKAAREAGAAAAKDVAEAMLKSSRNLRDTTNQFGGLVADLLGTDKQAAANARSIFEKILDRPLKPEERPAVSLSIGLESKPNETIAVDVEFMASEDNTAYEAVKQKFDGRNTSWSAHRINGVSLAPESEQALKKRVLSQAESFLRGRISNYNCKHGDLECRIKAEAKGLTDVIMKMLPSPATLPAKSLWTVGVPGGLYAVIIARKQDIRRLSKDATLVAWVHDSASPDNKINKFKGGDPWKLAISDWTKHCVDTKTLTTGELCWTFMDMRLQALLAYNPPALPVPK